MVVRGAATVLASRTASSLAPRLRGEGGGCLLPLHVGESSLNSEMDSWTLNERECE